MLGNTWYLFMSIHGVVWEQYLTLVWKQYPVALQEYIVVDKGHYVGIVYEPILVCIIRKYGHIERRSYAFPRKENMNYI